MRSWIFFLSRWNQWILYKYVTHKVDFFFNFDPIFAMQPTSYDYSWDNKIYRTSKKKWNFVVFLGRGKLFKNGCILKTCLSPTETYYFFFLTPNEVCQGYIKTRPKGEFMREGGISTRTKGGFMRTGGGAEGGPRTPRGQLNSAKGTRTWRGPRLWNILKHKYLMFFYVLRMQVLPQNAVMEAILSLQI